MLYFLLKAISDFVQAVETCRLDGGQVSACSQFVCGLDAGTIASLLSGGVG